MCALREAFFGQVKHIYHIVYQLSVCVVLLHQSILGTTILLTHQNSMVQQVLKLLKLKALHF